jgi:putative SOS response-associated peptidase YedK
MIVTEPNKLAAEIHDRMPVILEHANVDAWLHDGGTRLLRPAANGILQRWPVSKRVNSSKADAEDATLIDNIELAA